jgi:hypothetical protein
VGCGDANRSKLVGNWDIERANRVFDRVNQSDDEMANSENESEPGDSAIAPKMQIQFLGNGSLATITHMGTMTPAPKQGSWEMVSFDESSNQMKVKCVIGMQTSEHDIEFVDKDTIKLVPPNMAGLTMKIRFTRRK